VKASREDLLSGALAERLRALLIERGVLVFRDLDINLDEQQAITAIFGKVRTHANGALEKVTLDKNESAEYAAYFPATFFWHIDGHYTQTVPCFGASLRPAKLPPSGGETEFLNTYAAYEDLPAAEKTLIDGLRVVHSRPASMFRAYPDATAEQAAKWLRETPAIQPLVWEHESGRKSLLLSNSASHIDGMHPADSFDLITRLRSHMTQAQYVYTHIWRMNDLMVWDNTGAMYRARPFDAHLDRLLTRFTLEGEEPIKGPGQ
jgi:alpha-ketoglutarate-dependent taurine dioxygenase